MKDKRRFIRSPHHGSTGAALTAALTASVLVASGCATTDGVAAAQATPGTGGSVVTAPPLLSAEVGPPPITALTANDAFVDSPAAHLSGSRTANTIGSEAIAFLPEPDPGNRFDPTAAETEVASEIGRTANARHRRTGTETLVAHAAVPVVDARTEPRPSAPVVSTHEHPTERGVPLVFQVLQGPVDGWVQVMLPVRPNGTTGWIPVTDLELTRNRYRIDLDVSRHELTLFRDGQPLIETKVALGNGATPTPIGRFYLTELLRPPDPSGIYGPFAYGLSGFSESLDSFNGGPGIIGIHGTNQPQLLGTDVSHGCIRVDNDVIAEMSTFLPLGTPVAIHHGPVTLDPNEPF